MYILNTWQYLAYWCSVIKIKILYTTTSKCPSITSTFGLSYLPVASSYALSSPICCHSFPRFHLDSSFFAFPLHVSLIHLISKTSSIFAPITFAATRSHCCSISSSHIPPARIIAPRYFSLLTASIISLYSSSVLLTIMILVSMRLRAPLSSSLS